MRIYIIILFLVVGCATSLENAGWDEIAKKAYNIDKKSPQQKVDSSGIVANALLSSPRFYIKELEFLVQRENFDPVLWALYISYNLSVGQINGQIKSMIIEFSDSDPDNALPLYFLSCYYLQNEEKSKSIVALQKGNQRNNCNLYVFERKKYVFDYVMALTGHELTGYISQFSVHNSEMFTSLRKIVQEFCKPEQTDSVRNATIKMGEKIENHSVDVIEKYYSISLQASCVNNVQGVAKLEEIKKKREYFQTLLEKGQNRYGYDNFMHYLRTAFFKGEVLALEGLK